MKLFSRLYRSVLLCLLFALAFTLMIFFPSFAGIDGFDGGFAISLVSLVCALTAFVLIPFFAKRAGAAERMLKQENTLVHWEYTDSLWREYAAKQFKADSRDKRNLFLLMAGFFGIAIIVILIIGGEDGPATALILLGIVALLGLVAFLSAWGEHAHNLRSREGAFITRDGVMLNGRLHMWRGWGASLEKVAVEDGNPALLIFDYSAPSGYARGYYTVRVPIPPGQMETAVKIADEIKKPNKGLLTNI